MKRVNIAFFVFLFVAFIFLVVSGQAAQDQPVVLTCLQSTYSFASVLTKGTSIKVVDLSPPGYPIERLNYYFKKHEEQVKAYVTKADAVITITNVWKQDPLFIYARKWNIRVIEIDASTPFDPELTGVSVLEVPSGSALSPGARKNVSPCKDRRAISPYIWLSLSNASKMIGIIAADLKRLSPTDAPAIDKNLVSFKREVFRLKLEYENRFAPVEGLEVFSLTDVFPYLTNDLNIHVRGYFLKDDFYWTKEDLVNLKMRLQQDNIKVVIHKWEPKAEIGRATNEAGARLVVLDSMDPGLWKKGELDPDGYMKTMRKNLAAIAEAFGVK